MANGEAERKFNGSELHSSNFQAAVGLPKMLADLQYFVPYEDDILFMLRRFEVTFRQKNSSFAHN